MMKKTFLILLFIVASTVYAQRPKWINNVEDHCKKSQICAVGVGETLVIAQTRARANVAKVLSVQIKSLLTTDETLSQSLDLTAQNDVLMHDYGQEIVDLEVEGITHTKSYRDDQYDYSFAVLNKHTYARGVKEKMDDIQDELKMLVSRNSIGSLIRLKSKLEQWKTLSFRYRFLTGLSSPVPFSREHLEKHRRKIAQGIVVHVHVDGDMGVQRNTVSLYLAKILSDLGFKTTVGKEWPQGSTHLLLGDLVVNKMHFKVKGFEKRKYTLSMKAMNRRRVGSGHTVIEIEQTGRNKRDIENKVSRLIKDKIVQNIDSISFR